MEYQGRRGRRGRGHSRANASFPNHVFTSNSAKPWSLTNSLYSFFVMTSLIGIIYLMLEHHCSNCTAKYDVNNITKNIDDIAKNLSRIKECYGDLEMKISKFSQDLPKIEGQIEVLEALANTMEGKKLQWNPKTYLSLPEAGVYVNQPKRLGNFSKKFRKHLPKSIIVDQD